MEIAFGFVMLLIIYVLWKLFIDGWLFKIILFIAGWFGLYVALRIYVAESVHTAITFGGGTTMSWAVVIPTVICFLALLCTRMESD